MLVAKSSMGLVLRGSFKVNWPETVTALTPVPKVKL